jgi:D-alanyl-D-alanine carboxypeptidase
MISPAACAPIAGNPVSEAEKLRSLLAKDREKYALRAVIFAATRNSKPVLIEAFGDSTLRVPASTAMHFRIGMPAEQMEATLTLLLVDQRRLALTDTVSTWFPDYPHAKLATIRMLGASSTGFGDYVYGPANTRLHIPSFGDLVHFNPHRSFTTADLIRRSQPPYQVPQYADPGGNWMYSHTNFVMLGSILESVTKRQYADLINGDIFEKLGLNDTVFPATSAIAAPELHAFTSERGKYEDSTGWSPSWTSFSGNVNSTVCDLVKWEDAFGTGALLTPQSFGEIAASTNVDLGHNTSKLYFGFGTIVSNGWLVATGNFFGWHTAAAYYPPSHTTIAVTVTETPQTQNAAAELNDMLTQVSTILAPQAPLAFPPPRK